MSSDNPVVQWFFRIGDTVHGPITYVELRQKAIAGEITPDTLIRRESEDRWVLASLVHGPFVHGEPLPSVTLPTPSPPVTPAPLSTDAPPASSMNPTWTMGWRLGVLATAGFVTGALIWGALSPQGDRNAASTAGQTSQTMLVGEPAQQPNCDDGSPAEIYAHASPAVVTLKIYNDLQRCSFSGSGFILALRPAEPFEVDADAKRFAADLNDCTDAAEFVEGLRAKLAPKELLSDSKSANHGAFLKARRQTTKLELPNLQQAYIATNYHVIESAVSIHVGMHDGSTGFVSQVIHEDDSADVAILLAWLSCAKRPVAIALSAVPPNFGAKVFAIGSPMGLENTLSEGLISGIRGNEPGPRWLQTTASISHGSSGGPILATNGRVVGIVTANRPGGQNLNFAVPASEVLRLLNKPPKPREVWRGRSFQQEKRYAFDRAYAALNSRKGGAAAAKALADSQKASYGRSLAKILFKSVGEAEQATIEAIRFVPPEFQHLAYFYAGSFQHDLGFSARERGETVAESARRARSNPHYQAALAAYRKSADLKPDFAPAFHGLMAVHVCMGEWPKAYLDVDRLMALVPHCANVYVDRAICFSNLGKHKAAVKDLTIAAGLDPADALLQSFMADEYMRLAEYDNAIEAYQRSILLRPESQHFLSRYNIGIAHKFSGRYEEAIRAFLRCMKAPDCPNESIKSCGNEIDECKAQLRKLGRPTLQ